MTIMMLCRSNQVDTELHRVRSQRQELGLLSPEELTYQL